MELRITPHGHVVADGGRKNPLAFRFAEHEAAGMVALAAGGVPECGGASLGFWHDVAAAFLRAVCHLPEGVDFTVEEIERPSPSQWVEWVLNAPPMPGGEYLAPDVLAAQWERMIEWTAARVAESGGLAAFLDAYAPRWARVGRVTLHLAENHDKGTDPLSETDGQMLMEGGTIPLAPCEPPPSFTV